MTQAEVKIGAGTGIGLALGWDSIGGRLNPDLLPVLLGGVAAAKDLPPGCRVTGHDCCRKKK